MRWEICPLGQWYHHAMRMNLIAKMVVFCRSQRISHVNEARAGNEKEVHFLPCEMAKSGLLTTRLFRQDGWAVMEVQDTGRESIRNSCRIFLIRFLARRKTGPAWGLRSA